MLLLTTAALPQLQQHHHPNLGRLITPRHFCRLATRSQPGTRWRPQRLFSRTEPGSPFVGGGTTAIACWQTRREFTGGDLNPHAISSPPRRLLSEHAWPADRQPSLLSA